MVIQITMRIKMDGAKRPVCLDCDHSIMSHGERDGKLFCWGCAGVGQTQCIERKQNGNERISTTS